MNPIDQVRSALNQFGLGDVVLELNDSARTAQMAADAIGVHFNTTIPVGAIVKSLLFLIEDRPTIVLVSGDRIVKEKLIGMVCNVSRKKVKLADAATVLKVTGYEVGGVPPIGHAQVLPVLIDQALDRFTTVWAAAGAHHAVFPIEYAKLIEITRSQVAAITEDARGAQGATS
jgi:prolyl-tRNA editing enzyme YbaK/EbsC (Cys-tRNA(Pro) deacylase)